MADEITSIAEFIASEVGFYSPGMVVQAQDLIASLAECGFAVVAADELTRLRAAGDEMAMHLDAHYGLGAPCPSDVRHALVTWREARRG